MDPGPLPPHERPWRHPSELGPPEHEPTSHGGRILIVTTATFGLILVALLAVAVTPSSTTSTDDAPPTVLVAVRAVPATVATFSVNADLPVVAPFGDQGMALTTASAVGDHQGGLAAQLPSGQVVDVAIVSVDEARGIAIVALPAGVTTETFAVPTDDAPALIPDDTVLVHADEPIVVSIAHLSSIDVGEGTPVTDADGNLLGLCTLDEAHATALTVTDDDALAGAVDQGGEQPGTTTDDTTAVVETVDTTAVEPAASNTAPVTTHVPAGASAGPS